MIHLINYLAIHDYRVRFQLIAVHDRQLGVCSNGPKKKRAIATSTQTKLTFASVCGSLTVCTATVCADKGIKNRQSAKIFYALGFRYTIFVLAWSMPWVCTRFQLDWTFSCGDSYLYWYQRHNTMSLNGSLWTFHLLSLVRLQEKKFEPVPFGTESICRRLKYCHFDCKSAKERSTKKATDVHGQMKLLTRKRIGITGDRRQTQETNRRREREGNGILTASHLETNWVCGRKQKIERHQAALEHILIRTYLTLSAERTELWLSISSNIVLLSTIWNGNNKKHFKC